MNGRCKVLKFLIPAVVATWLVGCDGGAVITETLQDDTARVQNDQEDALVERVNLRHFGDAISLSGCTDNIGACAGNGLNSASFAFHADNNESTHAIATDAMVAELGSGLIVAAADDGSRAFYRIDVSSKINAIDIDLLTNGVELYSVVTPYSDEGSLRVSPSNRARAPIVTLGTETPVCYMIGLARCDASLVVQHFSSSHDRRYRGLIMGRVGSDRAYHILAQPLLLDRYYTALELEVALSTLTDAGLAADSQVELRVLVSDQTFSINETFNNLRDVPGAAYVTPPLWLSLQLAE